MCRLKVVHKEYWFLNSSSPEILKMYLTRAIWRYGEWQMYVHVWLKTQNWYAYIIVFADKYFKIATTYVSRGGGGGGIIVE